MRPTRRRTGLLVDELGDETLVYDLMGHKAHCLNRPARLVWEQCDGQRTTSEIAEDLREALGAAADPRVIALAIERLGRARLLDEPPCSKTARARGTRRALIRQLGLTAVTAPVIVTMLAPSAAAAASICSGVPPCMKLGGCPPGTSCRTIKGQCMCF